ncbi:hypothetical protein NDU88_010235 [Pleurodeles waltl]|uniref:Uncharacterized protein n=1 Tax=Pleurodeles waltl TaxID=8319 RepID=A0AAV7S2Q6_PLEWA|nr:hypothetical protein NDU88_010235 [Pleurodeles waltl]
MTASAEAIKQSGLMKESLGKPIDDESLRLPKHSARSGRKALGRKVSSSEMAESRQSEAYFCVRGEVFSRAQVVLEFYEIKIFI